MSPFEPDSDGIEILLFDLNPRDPIPARVAALLDKQERQRAARFRNPEDRYRYGVARAALRLALAARLQVPPASLRFIASPAGKPRLVEHALEFNISHAGRLVAIALSGHPVGVDVERVDPSRDVCSLAKEYFSEDEAKRIAGASHSALEFTHIWTAKEAVLKSAGSGLAIALNLFTVSGAVGWRPILTDVPALEGIHVCRLNVGIDYAGAIASRRPAALDCRWMSYDAEGRLSEAPAQSAATCRS